MNRFDSRPSVLPYAGRLHLSIFVMAAILFLFLYGVSTVSTSTVDNQQKSLEQALNRSIVQCYAVEGTYPPSLSYLKDHYGLTYDESLFFVDYQSIGANIMPDVT